MIEPAQIYRVGLNGLFYLKFNMIILRTMNNNFKILIIQFVKIFTFKILKKII